MSESKYTSENIKVFEDLQGIRHRPNMYIGNTLESGLIQCLTEVFVNSIDEVGAGHGDVVKIKLLNPIGFELSDNGHGMPIDPFQNTGIPTVTILFTKPHSGGKMEANGVYKNAIGQNGIGCKIINALSEKTVVDITRDNVVYEQTFSRGYETSKLVKTNKVAEYPSGTKITWIPDSKIFKEVIEYNYNKVKDMVQTQAYLNPGNKFVLSDERTNKSETIISENGLFDMMKGRLGDDKPLFKPIHIKAESDKYYIEAIFTYTDNSYEDMISYVNSAHVPEGGSHVQAFRSGFTRAINDISRQNGFLKDKDSNIGGNELREGLSCIISFKMSEPPFENQTKTKLSAPDIIPFIQETVYNKLIAWASDKPKETKVLVDRILLTRRIKEASKKAREMVLGNKAAKKSNLTLTDSKLAHCVSKKPEECELIIIEGDSAAGTVKNARDSRFQAVYPLRGKILNVEKHGEVEAYSNQVIKDLTISIGCGVKDDLDLKKLRYHKIIISADRDPDGSAIELLLLNYFFRYMLEVITHGHLFISLSPLFINTIGKQKYFTYDEKEQEEFLLKHKNEKISDIQRIKGLGELNANVFREQVLNPKTRRLIQVKIEDFEKASEIIHMLQGNDSTHRKRLIETGEL